MDIILKIIQVILALSLLVIVHEFGHFLFAKLFGMRVEKFYLFFPPAIFKFKPKNSDTEFGIGCIPLGGFCKISGMVDESMDTEAISREPQPWEFRSKPAWQRLLVLFGGVFFNFLLAIALYSAILGTWGEEYLKNKDAVYGIEPNALALELGFRPGDRIIAFDGECQDEESFTNLQVNLVRMQARQATVLRDGDTLTVAIDEEYIPAILNTPGMFALRSPVAVASIPDTSINIASGIKTGDIFRRIADKEVFSFSEVQAALAPLRDTTVEITFLRENALITVAARTDASGKIQVLLQGDISDFEITRKEYPLLQAVRAGAGKTFGTISGYVQELGLIFSPKTQAYKSVGSFIAIGSIFPSSWDWHLFWSISAYLSVMLAVLNIIPIPGLDGGHIFFTLWEIITRRRPSDRFLEKAQIVGMIILLLLVILAFGNDITRLFR